MHTESLPDRVRRLDDAVREARVLLATVRGLFETDLSHGANENRGGLTFCHDTLGTITGDTAFEVAQALPGSVTPELHARADRHRADIDALRRADAELLHELDIVRSSLKAARDLLQLFRERADILEITYGTAAETVTEQDTRILRFIADVQALLVRYRNLERAIQALMVLEH